MKPTIHVLTGCTAVGKTEWALRWAEAQNAEIISCDSLLFYQHMDIGTAKPSAAELARVPHHLIDVVAAAEPMDITRYITLARAAVEKIAARGRKILVTGGSGFYLKSFFGPVADDVAVPAEVRAIDFAEDGSDLRVDAPPALEARDDGPRPSAIRVSGWAATRSASVDAPLRGGIPILWTPSIKALWAPLVPVPSALAGANDADALPLHGLRLSASSLRIHLCGQPSSAALGIPLPIGLSVDNVRIEISREREEVL
jgi:hypothetical protein